jgi:hypothetical protein
VAGVKFMILDSQCLHAQGQQYTPKGEDCETRHGDDDVLSA